MKKFPGQAKNEKILFYSKENFLHYFIRKFTVFLITIWVALFISFIYYFITQDFNISLMLFIIVLVITWGYMLYLYNNTYVILTNKRILKFVRNWLFSEHMKELKLDQLNEVSSTKMWIIEKLFQIGNIKIVGKDKENVIWFQWIKYPKEVVLYISRLRDYLFVENPDYNLDEIKEFIPRKKRKKFN